MPIYPYKGLPLKKAKIDSTHFKKSSNAQLGTKKSPAKITVQTEERKQSLLPIFTENGWAYEITVDQDLKENILDLEFLQRKQPAVLNASVPGRNDPCACGSGKKFKKCCGA